MQVVLNKKITKEITSYSVGLYLNVCFSSLGFKEML